MDKIRIGIFGAEKGSYFFNSIMQNNGDIVAVCGKNEKHLAKTKEKLGDDVTFYTSLDEFINHPMDAVPVANYFHEHAEYAIGLLEKNFQKEDVRIKYENDYASPFWYSNGKNQKFPVAQIPTTSRPMKRLKDLKKP